ncbi:MAG TPA: DUF3078 domain-containing protein [Chitinophagaceae bacterium]|nr:DUF3078 domain-containing protein [Chitinophagaceae bacterium]
MKHLLLCIGLMLALNLTAQDETIRKLKSDSETGIKKDPNDTTQQIWRKGATLGINIAQGSLSNWAAGGDDFSLSVNGLASLFAFYKRDRHSWDNTFDLNLGYIKTTSLGSRKNDDRIDLLSKYGYALNDKLNVGGLFNFRSQLFKGYTYDGQTRMLTSAFLSPAYILLSPGLDFKPRPNLSFFISPATVRWVIVKDDSLAARGLYGVEPGQNSRTEIGAFLTMNYLTDFTKTVSYKGRLDLFSNYRDEPKNVDVFMTNLFAVKLSRILSATWSLDLIYDDNVQLFGPNRNAARIQVKSLVGVGVLVKY